MEFLRELDDPSKYRKRTGVPIGRAFRRQLRNGAWAEVKEDELPTVAEKTLAAELDSGSLPRITLGHIDSGVDEKDQVHLVGFIRNPRPGTFGPKSVPCVLGDTYTMVEFEQSELSRQYPYRSMEYRVDKGRITGLALLKRDPFSDLGVVLFHDDGGEAILVSLEEDGMGDNQPAPAPAPAAPPAAPQQPVQMSAEDKTKADALMAYFMTANPWMAKCAAEFGDQKPDGTDGDNKPVDNPKDGDKPKEDDVDKDKTAQMQADLAASKVEIARLAKEADEAKVDKMLAILEAECQCDVAHERETLLSFAADKREKYLANARKQYPKKPVGAMIETYRGRVEGGGPSKELNREQMDAALVMMQADPTLTVAAARERVLKG